MWVMWPQSHDPHMWVMWPQSRSVLFLEIATPFFPVSFQYQLRKDDRWSLVNGSPSTLFFFATFSSLFQVVIVQCGKKLCDQTPPTRRVVWLQTPPTRRVVWLQTPPTIRMVWLQTPPTMRMVWLKEPKPQSSGSAVSMY